MTIRQWFSFQGRIGRKTWWLGYVLPLFAAWVAANIVDVALGLAALRCPVGRVVQRG